MSADGDFSELIRPFAQMKGFNAERIIGHFHLTTDEVFGNWGRILSNNNHLCVDSSFRIKFSALIKS